MKTMMFKKMHHLYSCKWLHHHFTSDSYVLMKEWIRFIFTKNKKIYPTPYSWVLFHYIAHTFSFTCYSDRDQELWDCLVLLFIHFLKNTYISMLYCLKVRARLTNNTTVEQYRLELSTIQCYFTTSPDYVFNYCFNWEITAGTLLCSK